MVRRIVMLIAAGSLAGMGQAQTGQTGNHNPIVKNAAPHTVAAPAHGANSFSARQAAGRFTKAGYSNISKLTKADGIWQGTAMKDGKSRTVMLDYKGNITAR